MHKQTDSLFWVITTPVQIWIGFATGTVGFIMGEGELRNSFVLMWLCTTLGVFFVELLAIAIFRKNNPKKYLKRLILVALFTSIPIIFLASFDIALNFDNEIIGIEEPQSLDGIGDILRWLPPLLGKIGFYTIDWWQILRNKK